MDRREERVKSITDLADAYLEAYKLRARAAAFADYALGHVVRHLGKHIAVEVTDKTVKDYQTARLKEKAARRQSTRRWVSSYGSWASREMRSE